MAVVCLALAAALVILTVALLSGLVAAFVQFTEREPRTLVYPLLSGDVFAVANQFGDAGSSLLALVPVVAGIGYAVIVVRG